MGESVTLYAAWCYNLTFDGNGGKCSDEGENSGKEKIVLEKIHHGRELGTPSFSHSQETHIFDGWSLTKDGLVVIQPDETVKKSSYNA